MNEPLTAHPRASIYGTYDAHFPDIRSTRRSRAVPRTRPTSPRPVRPPPGPPGRPRPLRAAAELHGAEPPGGRSSRPARRPPRRDARRPRDGGSGSTRPSAFAERGVAVLAPHRAQNAAIRHALAALGFGGAGGRPMPLVDTVEKLQGKEREVVVVSYGVADAEYADAEADFLLSQARFNVASTRAQRKLVVLCSDPVLDAVPADRQALSRPPCSRRSATTAHAAPPCGRGRTRPTPASPSTSTSTSTGAAFDRARHDRP